MLAEGECVVAWEGGEVGQVAWPCLCVAGCGEDSGCETERLGEVA